MLKSCLALLTLVFMATIALGQRDPINTPQILLDQIKNASDTNLIRLQLQLAEYYVRKEGKFTVNRDSALTYFSQALKSSDYLHSDKWRNETLMMTGNCYLEFDDIQHGSPCFEKVILYDRKIKNKWEEARTWERFGDSFSRNPELLQRQINVYMHAMQAYKQAGNRLFEIHIAKKISDVHMTQGKYNLAEAEMLKVLKDLKSIGFKHLHYTYDLLASVNKLKGTFHQELFYKIEAVKSMEATKDYSQALYFYYNLAMIYFDLGFYEKSLIFYKKTLPYSIKAPSHDKYYELLMDITKVMIVKDRANEALRFLKDQTKTVPPVNYKQRQWLNAAFGNCYQKMGLNAVAESYYLKMIKFADLDYSIKVYGDYYTCYTIISNFYLLTHQYSKARASLKKVMYAPNSLIRPSLMSQIELMSFKIDSASGRLNLAIVHYQAYKKLNDSLFNATNKKLLEEVEIRNESENKDRNIELQSKSIQLLKKQSQIEQYQVAKTQAIKNVFLGGSLMLSVLLALGYNRYRLKQRNNLQLEEKQAIISEKNITLEKLLRNNKWLVREAHHRVKNNMQIIISLLSSQAVYLKDKVALNAVSDSRHRIQTMSLIHQKLYGKNNSTTIFMKEYIKDLVDYLFESFRVTDTIILSLDIDPVYLDVIQAVPVGLILNEAITNSIKHAFPHTRNDRLVISLKVANNDELLLVVSDNGCGMARKFNTAEVDSFGLKLIRGLAADLQGNLTLESNQGTTIMIKFLKVNAGLPVD